MWSRIGPWRSARWSRVRASVKSISPATATTPEGGLRTPRDGNWCAHRAARSILGVFVGAHGACPWGPHRPSQCSAGPQEHGRHGACLASRPPSERLGRAASAVEPSADAPRRGPRTPIPRSGRWDAHTVPGRGRPGAERDVGPVREKEAGSQCRPSSGPHAKASGRSTEPILIRLGSGNTFNVGHRRGADSTDWAEGPAERERAQRSEAELADQFHDLAKGRVRVRTRRPLHCDVARHPGRLSRDILDGLRVVHGVGSSWLGRW